MRVKLDETNLVLAESEAIIIYSTFHFVYFGFVRWRIPLLQITLDVGNFDMASGEPHLPGGGLCNLSASVLLVANDGIHSATNKAYS